MSATSTVRPVASGPPARAMTAPARAVLVVLVKPWAGWAARSALVGRPRSRRDPARGRFRRADVRRMLRGAWARFDRLRAELPAEPTAGSRLNVMLAALTLAMLDAVVDQGVERNYAVELVGDAAWRIYAQWGRVPRLVARLVTNDPARRMRICVNTFLRFPFNRPGYRYQDRPEPAGRALDMLRCPVADYLGAHGASDLAVGAWCNLDFELARMWGGTLERHGSLAAGDPRCDFRFKARPMMAPASSRVHADPPESRTA